MPDSIKIRLKNLPLVQKGLLLGSFLTVISVFMPWYSDVDKFNIGKSFLGISGPLYLAGFFVFIAGACSLALIAMHLLEKNVPKLPLKESQIHLAGSILSLFMLILTASAYFHPDFGVDPVRKSASFGMVVAFIGAGLMMAGAIMASRVKEVDFNTEGHMSPLIDLDMSGREKSDLGVRKNITVGDAMNQYQGTKSGWGPVEESINTLNRHEE